MYLSHREPDKEDCFKHEIQSFPASLSDCGKIHFPTAKSSLLESILPTTDDSQRLPHNFDCIIIDGAAIVHMLIPNDPAIKTFQEYAQRVIIPYINFQFQACHRIDLVFDQYFSDSLKNAVREKRGSGTRWKVEPNVKLPKKWHDFLLDSQNKEELFTFLANTIANFKFIEGKQIYVTLKSRVLMNDVPMSDCRQIPGRYQDASISESCTREWIDLIPGENSGYRCYHNFARKIPWYQTGVLTFKPMGSFWSWKSCEKYSYQCNF